MAVLGSRTLAAFALWFYCLVMAGFGLAMLSVVPSNV